MEIPPTGGFLPIVGGGAALLDVAGTGTEGGSAFFGEEEAEIGAEGKLSDFSAGFLFVERFDKDCSLPTVSCFLTGGTITGVVSFA